MPTRAGLMVDIAVGYSDGSSTHRYKSYDPTTANAVATQDYTSLSVSQVLSLNTSQPIAPGTPWNMVGSPILVDEASETLIGLYA